MLQTGQVSRRKALAIGAGAAALPLVHICTAGAAGRLSVAFLSGFIPEQDAAMAALAGQWGRENGVEVEADFVTLLGNKYILTLAAESQARMGHDIIMPFGFDLATYGHLLEPMDDLVGRLSSSYGRIAPLVEYLGTVTGAYRGVPASYQSVGWPSCTRIDLFRQHVGMDVMAVFPVAAEMGSGYDQWTWDDFLVAAEKCAGAGHPFGLPVGQTSDSSAWIAALFRSFGAALVDKDGRITARSDNVRAALDYAKRLMPFLPPSVVSWDNASNNRALLSGESALIFNPPSAWAAAFRDNRKLAGQIWHHPLPAGPHGRFLPVAPSFWGVWEFSRNKTAAREFIEWLSQRPQVEKLCNAGYGYDLPPFDSMIDFPVWAEVGPPKGTVFNYPARPQHHAEPTVAGWPAPPGIANRISNAATLPKLVARVAQRDTSFDHAIDLAEQELEGFMR